jgi:hypothetical protein
MKTGEISIENPCRIKRFLSPGIGTLSVRDYVHSGAVDEIHTVLFSGAGKGISVLSVTAPSPNLKRVPTTIVDGGRAQI